MRGQQERSADLWPNITTRAARSRYSCTRCTSSRLRSSSSTSSALWCSQACYLCQVKFYVVYVMHLVGRVRCAHPHLVDRCCTRVGTGNRVYAVPTSHPFPPSLPLTAPTYACIELAGCPDCSSRAPCSQRKKLKRATYIVYMFLTND